MQIPVDVKAVIDEATNIDEARQTPLSVSVDIDESAPGDGVARGRGAFASAWLSTLWNVRSAWVGCVMLIAIIPLMLRSRRA